jgi:hypothetical protein
LQSNRWISANVFHVVLLHFSREVKNERERIGETSKQNGTYRRKE